MNLEEAGRTLRKMYDAAPHGEKVGRIYLFGIQYADELNGLTSKDIVARSGINEPYHTEVSKGCKRPTEAKRRERRACQGRSIWIESGLSPEAAVPQASLRKTRTFPRELLPAIQQ